MTDDTLRAALREAYTLLVSAEPTLIRDAEHAPNETSARYKALLRDRVTGWLDPIRDNFDGWAAALASVPDEGPHEHPPSKAQRESWMNAGQFARPAAAPAPCGCTMDAAAPGTCPYCHHREHGSTGCLAASATDEPCPGCRVYLGHPDRVPDAASATDEQWTDPKG